MSSVHVHLNQMILCVFLSFVFCWWFFFHRILKAQEQFAVEHVSV